MSAGLAHTLNHTSSLNCETPATMVTDLRKTESLETLPEISPTTFPQDKRELSAWYRTRDTPNGRETPQSFPHSDPSSSDERDVSQTPSDSRVFVCSSLSPTSTLTSLESHAETESSLTSWDSDPDDDAPIFRTSAHLATSDSISQATTTSPSKPARKRKRSRCQPARYSKRLMAKKRKVAPI